MWNQFGGIWRNPGFAGKPRFNIRTYLVRFEGRGLGGLKEEAKSVPGC